MNTGRSGAFRCHAPQDPEPSGFIVLGVRDIGTMGSFSAYVTAGSLIAMLVFEQLMK
jgi:hypothetical protein